MNQPTEHACVVGVASDMLICVPLLTVSGEVVILEVSCSRTVRLSVVLPTDACSFPRVFVGGCLL